jgi:hypothetical protein
MPRELKAAAQRDARRGTQRGTQDYTEGTQSVLRGYSGDSWGCGVHVGLLTHGSTRTRAHTRKRSLSSRLWCVCKRRLSVQL